MDFHSQCHICYSQLLGKLMTALGVEKERGALRVGMKGDIIATVADPLENIQTIVLPVKKAATRAAFL
jgi:hypothetical protein